MPVVYLDPQTSSSFSVPVAPFNDPSVGVEYVAKYTGEANVPQDIRRRRRQVYDALRRFGQPCIFKHMYTIADVEAGIAKPSPNFDPVYGQTRNEDPFSHGVGFVSVEDSDNEWIGPDGRIVLSYDSPGSRYIKAPKYRGFGPGYLCYSIIPDIAEDTFKLDPTGVLIKTQTALCQTSWFPDIGDNDIMAMVQLDRLGRVSQINERYRTKMVNPVSLRGYNRYGHKEYQEDGANKYVVNQTFEITRIPENLDYVHDVEMDR